MIRRGEIWWGSLGPPRGSGPGFRRPLVVVQSNDFNRSGIRTVVAVVVTSNRSLAAAPGNVALPKTESGLAKDSVANVSQVVTVDRSYLTERVGTLPASLLGMIDAGLRLLLAL